MERIGVRELRQNASRWLARVAAGETFEITDRGRLIAVLSPARTVSARDRLDAAGRLVAARHDLRKVRPLAATKTRPPLNLSQVLTDLRDEDR